MQDVDDKLRFWLGEFPESSHPLDQRRFYDFVEALAATNEYVDGDWLVQHAQNFRHDLNEGQLVSFSIELEALVSYIRHRR